MTRYQDLVDEAVEQARWEGPENPLADLVVRLADAVEELSGGQEDVMIRNGKNYVKIPRDGSVWIGGEIKIANRVS